VIVIMFLVPKDIISSMDCDRKGIRIRRQTFVNVQTTQRYAYRPRKYCK